MNSRALPERIRVEDVQRAGDLENRWCGKVTMPGERSPSHVLIFQRGQSYSAIPASCPHEGFRLDDCPDDGSGHVVCPMHGQRVRIENDPASFRVERDAEGFFVLPPAPTALPGTVSAGYDEVLRLQDEVEALRGANSALEAQVVAVSQQMEVLVEELAAKTRTLEQFGIEHQRTSAFVGRVMDTMDNLVLLLDRRGYIQRVNPVVETLLGYGPAELLGKSADMLLGPADLALLRANGGAASAAAGSVMFRSVLSRRHWSMELHMSGRDGAMPCLLLHGAPLYDVAGKLEGVVIVGSDVTPLRGRERELIESEQRFRDYSDIASDWLWETDADLRFKPGLSRSADGDPRRRSMQDQYRMVVGLRTEQLAHRNDLLDTGKWVNFHATTDQRREYRDFEFCVYPPGGVPVWLSTSGQPMFGQDGQFLGYRGIAKDITARKAIEAELRRHRDHLSELVAEQTTDLVQARDAAEQASRMKSEFLANISHELRTPLHGVMSFAALGVQRAGSMPPEKVRDYFERIRQSGQRLSALVDDLLDLARLEAGRAKMNRVPTDVVALEQSARRGLEAMLAGKNLGVSVRAESVDPWVMLDTQRMSQVLLNLMSNAIKFSPPNGELTWIVADDWLSAEDGTRRAALRMTLEDQGPGIPEPELEAIFDKFVQSSQTKSGAGGTGLGLAICREIVLAHGGRIGARNLDRGAAFDILLPREIAAG